jgi:hypothetical protein
LKEKKMAIFDKLLRLRVFEDFNELPKWESTWVTDVIYQGLEEDLRDEQATASVPDTSQRPN